MHTDDTLKVDAAADLDFGRLHKYGFWVLPDGRLLRLVSGHASHDETAECYAEEQGWDKETYAYRELINLGCVRFSRDPRNEEAWINLHAGAVTVAALETTRAALSALKGTLLYSNLHFEDQKHQEGETYHSYKERSEVEGDAAIQRELGKLLRIHRKPGKEAA
jgi:hypothetical protein